MPSPAARVRGLSPPGPIRFDDNFTFPHLAEVAAKSHQLSRNWLRLADRHSFREPRDFVHHPQIVHSFAQRSSFFPPSSAKRPERTLAMFICFPPGLAFTPERELCILHRVSPTGAAQSPTPKPCTVLHKAHAAPAHWVRFFSPLSRSHSCSFVFIRGPMFFRSLGCPQKRL